MSTVNIITENKIIKKIFFFSKRIKPVEVYIRINYQENSKVAAARLVNGRFIHFKKKLNI